MKKNEIYWLNLYNEGKIKVDFDTGEVWSFLSGKNWHLLDGRHKSGYLQATAGLSRSDRNHMLLHRLIWIVANGEIPDNIEVNHKNGIKSDNRLINLELTNKSENALHSYRILGNKGGALRGENATKAKLKAYQVLEIRQRYKMGDVTLKFLGDEYGVNLNTIRAIIIGKNWKEK